MYLSALALYKSHDTKKFKIDNVDFDRKFYTLAKIKSFELDLVTL